MNAMRMTDRPATVIDTCRACRKPITHAGGNWVNADGHVYCGGTTGSTSGLLPSHEPVTGTPITTPLRELLILMAGDAAMYRQPSTSAPCPRCSAVLEDRCDECANEQALADEYDELKRRVRAVTTDAAAVAALVELVGRPEGQRAA